MLPLGDVPASACTSGISCPAPVPKGTSTNALPYPSRELAGQPARPFWSSVCGEQSARPSVVVA